MSLITDIAFWQEVYAIARVIFLVLDAALVTVFVYAVAKGWEYRPKFSLTPPSKRKTLTLRSAMFTEKWTRIKEKFALGTSEAVRIAIIEADAFIDEMLKQSGLEGEHMADRLSQLRPEEMKTLDRVWRAHRVRNDLVHTPAFSLSAAEAEQAMGDYEAFLKEMGVLG